MPEPHVVRRRAIGTIAAVLLTACAGSADDPSTTTDRAAADTTPADIAPATDAVVETSTTTTSVVPAPVPPVVSFEVVDDVVWIDRGRRAALDGADTYYWPDGNLGSVELGDGHITYFAANGSVTARTVGTDDDPAQQLLDSSVIIDGVSDEFGYAAGGPVHFDAASGTLLLWYHAERHLDGAALFHAAIGLARSTDGGATFSDLGIIIETNSSPNALAPCCADVGGAPVIERDGTFHLYFRDRRGSDVLTDVQLARASAPVAEVLAAAARGEVSEWTKHSASGPTPGIGGRSTELEEGNPRTNWFDVAWSDALDAYLMVIAEHGMLGDPSTLWLIASADGLAWSPRQELARCDCELTYPSFVGTWNPTGTDRIVDTELRVAYVATDADAAFRWERTDLRLVTATL